MKQLFLVIAVCFMASLATAQTYSLPNNNAGCPANCRQITWQAGSDIWNSGSLPVYSGATCSPLNANGVTDDTTNIQNCINAASAGTGVYATCHAAGSCAVLLPAASYAVSGEIRLKSNVVVRGAKPENVTCNKVGTCLPAAESGATTLIIGTGASDGNLSTQNFSNSTNLFPTTSFSTFPSTYCHLSGTPTKGDTTITLDAGNGSGCNLSAGSYIIVYGNDDPSLIYSRGTEGNSPGDHCDWCGQNTGFYLQTQIVQVPSFASGTGGAGSVANLAKALYYTLDVNSETVPGPGGTGTSTEPAKAHYSIITFPTTKAGYENLRVSGAAHNIAANQIINLRGCLYCWVKNVETFETGSSSGSAHMEMDFTYGTEVRNSYFHDQRSGASGSGYGIYFQFVNSDAKIENNVVRHSRHGLVYQGGGSGTAILYNYFDDMYTDDTTYLGSARTDHGAHPFFNLLEGNVISSIAADDFWGTSSHTVFWRNWIWGDETEDFNLHGCVGCAATGTPNNGFDAADLYTSQSYYAYVGNVLGTPASTSIPTGANDSCAITTTIGRHANWTNGTVQATCTKAFNGSPNCNTDPPGTPVGYELGSSQLNSAAVSSTSVIRNGNYDYKTLGVAFWDGGSTNNTLANSLYYGSKPSFFGSCRWPVAGYDQSPVIGVNPAEATYLGANISPTIPPCGVSPYPNARCDLNAVPQVIPQAGANPVASPTWTTGNITGIGTHWIDANFASPICRLTDQTIGKTGFTGQTKTAAGSGSGEEQRISVDNSMILVSDDGGRDFPLNVNFSTCTSSAMYTSLSPFNTGPPGGGWYTNTSVYWSRSAATPHVLYNIGNGLTGSSAAIGLKLGHFDFSNQGVLPTFSLDADLTSVMNTVGGGSYNIQLLDSGAQDATNTCHGFATSDLSGQGNADEVYALVWCNGLGARVLNVSTGVVVYADYGPTGAITGSFCPVAIHNVKMWGSGALRINYVSGCGSPVQATFTWQFAGLTYGPTCTTACSGHAANLLTGYVNNTGNPAPNFWSYRDYNAPGSPIGIIPALPAGGVQAGMDEHVGCPVYNNTFPCLVTTNVFGFVPTVAWANEGFMINPAGTNNPWRMFSCNQLGNNALFAGNFVVANCIASISQDGRYALFTSDQMCQLGGENFSGNTRPGTAVPGGPNWVAGTVYAPGAVITPGPGANNPGHFSFQTTAGGTAGGTNPNPWNQTLNGIQSDGGVTDWKDIGLETCAGDVFGVTLPLVANVSTSTPGIMLVDYMHDRQFKDYFHGLQFPIPIPLPIQGGSK